MKKVKKMIVLGMVVLSLMSALTFSPLILRLKFSVIFSYC